MSTYMVAPLMSGDECLGTLNVARQANTPYAEIEATMLHCLAHVIGSHVRIYQHLEHEKALTQTDTLTGLLNRNSFMNLARRVFADWENDATPFIVAVLDLDHFRELNDRYGHVGGDRVLVEFAHELRSMVREFDHVARLGGEAFAIILENMHERNAQAWASRLNDTVAMLEIPFEGDVIHCTVSVGISAPRADDTDVDRVISRAEHALEEAKATGRNRVVMSPPGR